MSRGRSNNLLRQVGEHLVCAELGRRGFTATPFSGNVPTFDVLATDDQCRTVPIQVKASSGSNWRSDAQQWMDLQLDLTSGIQHNKGPLKIENPNLIYVCVSVASAEIAGGRDRFFVLTHHDLQQACIAHYTSYMEPRGWKRAKKLDCYECRYGIVDIAKHENNWQLIEDRLAASPPDVSLSSPNSREG